MSALLHNMEESMLSERQFLSTYAPLQYDGPLPPGLNESTIKAVFRKFGFHPKRVLTVVGIRHFAGPPEKRLRKALDDFRIRARLAEYQHRPGSSLVFHNVLYHYLRNSLHGKGVYARLVQPAEYEDQGKIFLDAQHFARRLEAEKQEIGEVIDLIALRSSEEALAQFGLAFALLQPKEAYEILHPLLLMGPSYQDFFGATRTLISEWPELSAESKSANETPQAPMPQIATYLNDLQAAEAPNADATSPQESEALVRVNSEETTDVGG